MRTIYINLPDSRERRVVEAILREGRMVRVQGCARILYLDCGETAAPFVASCASFLESVQGTSEGECTVRSCAELLAPEQVQELMGLGVNRLCIPAHADNCGAAVEAVFGAREAGMERVAVDLFADATITPLKVWSRALERIVEAGAGHVSTYEGGQGDAHSDNGLACLEMADEFLHEAGYSRYELWSYALPGHACAYTVDCWRCHPYLGLGPGAASHDGRSRWTNTEDVDVYCAALEAGDLPPREVECFTPKLKASDLILCGLNLVEGVHLERARQEVERVFQTLENLGPNFSKHWKTLESTFAQLADEGLVIEEDHHWRLTGRGRYMADYVARAFV